MALFSYSDIEVLELIARINQVNPSLVAIADTYGVMYAGDASAYLSIFDRNLNKDIAVGFHSHNNLQMSNAACIELAGKDTLRQLVLDASLLGMGKNAGNACTEVIAAYLVKSGKRDFDIAGIIETAFTDIAKFQNSGRWGYDIKYLISAVEECSPKVVDYFIKLNGISISDMFSIIESLPAQRRIPSYFTDEIGREKYLEFANRSLSSADVSFADGLSARAVLVVAPGASVVSEGARVRGFIDGNDPVIRSVNHIPESAEADYVFVSNPHRYSQVIAQLADYHETVPELILTSNITQAQLSAVQRRVDFISLFNKCGGDNSSALLMAFLAQAGVRELWVAGLDGFSGKKNFSIANYEIYGNLSPDEYPGRNADIVRQLKNVSDIKINWITPTVLEWEL
jgi:4-hydroxy 2-oxovalerate aldolase